MTAADIWNSLEIKLIAILRGIKPEETAHAIEALLDTGFRAIEIPLNSPDPLESIGQIVVKHGAQTIVGAGTVLTVDQVAETLGISRGTVASRSRLGMEKVRATLGVDTNVEVRDG